MKEKRRKKKPRDGDIEDRGTKKKKKIRISNIEQDASLSIYIKI